MTSWTLLLCEGAHDQAALSALACACGEWKRQKKTPASCPEVLQKTYPVPKRNRHGAYEYQGSPAYLVKDDRWLVIRGLGNDVDVLSAAAVDAVNQFNPDAVGVFVDANDKGVGNRVRAFQSRYKGVRDLPKSVKPGVVIPGKPQLGIWVAPDNKNKGKMDDLLLKVAQRTKGDLIAAGEDFIKALQKIEFETKSLTDHRSKVLLGVVHQPVKPGASLAVGMQKTKCWLPSDASDVPELSKLLEFIEKLASP